MHAESLLVMRDLGVQVGTRYFSGREKKQFIERDSIECIVINEGIQTWTVFYYLAILVKGKERMVLPFEVRIPCFQCSGRDSRALTGAHLRVCSRDFTSSFPCTKPLALCCMASLKNSESSSAHIVLSNLARAKGDWPQSFQPE